MTTNKTFAFTSLGLSLTFFLYILANIDSWFRFEEYIPWLMILATVVPSIYIIRNELSDKAIRKLENEVKRLKAEIEIEKLKKELDSYK